nr:asparagine synthase (glutamine-hydrolyzing) [Bacteroidota bacterium]
LGHRRLSILDTSPAGHQPFTDLNGRHTIIYNGEIFNFPTLRKQLEDQGHNFRSNTDTEVILRLFILKGPAFLHVLNGFFTLAIHDAETDELFVARDRFGVKPLLWAIHEDRLIFGSEIRTLRKMGLPTLIDPVSLRMYFTHHYIPAPHTIDPHVNKLSPGHSIIVRAGKISVERWYDAESAAKDSKNIADPISHVAQLLDDSVKIRLLSDVPVGTFLSGGLDSSIISALAKKHKPDLQTFSIGFTDAYFDETAYAEQVAKHIGSDHTTFTLKDDDLAEHYSAFLSIIDEPFADSSALPSYLLNKFTRKHVVVALSGDGADEIFGGYRKHQAELRTRQPGFREQLAILGAPLWALMPRSRNNPLSDRFRQLDRFATVAGLELEERYLHLASFEQDVHVDELIGPLQDRSEWNSRRSRLAAPLKQDPTLNGLLWADLHTVLPNDMLYKVDLTSMAHGLEVRTPFLDHRLVSYAFSLPAEVKFKLGSGKDILRKAFSQLLPPTILTRPKKGFEVPLRKLFLGPLNDLVRRSFDRELLEDANISHSGVQQLLARLLSSSPGNSQATVHALLVYLSWWKEQRH